MSAHEGDAIRRSSDGVLPDERFCRFAGVLAPVVAVVGLAYSIAFVLDLKYGSKTAATASAVFLLIGSLLATPVLVATYVRLRRGGPAFALWVLLVALVSAVGSAIHGAFDLANAVNPPSRGLGDLANTIDPRGFLTFGMAGLGVAALAWLILRTGLLPARLGTLAGMLGGALILIYLGRLIILNPKNPLLLGIAAITGVVLNPLWWIWLGAELRRTASTDV